MASAARSAERRDGGQPRQRDPLRAAGSPAAPRRPPPQPPRPPASRASRPPRTAPGPGCSTHSPAVSDASTPNAAKKAEPSVRRRRRGVAGGGGAVARVGLGEGVDRVGNRQWAAGRVRPRRAGRALAPASAAGGRARPAPARRGRRRACGVCSREPVPEQVLRARGRAGLRARQLQAVRGRVRAAAAGSARGGWRLGPPHGPPFRPSETGPGISGRSPGKIASRSCRRTACRRSPRRRSASRRSPAAYRAPGARCLRGSRAPPPWPSPRPRRRRPRRVLDGAVEEPLHDRFEPVMALVMQMVGLGGSDQDPVDAPPQRRRGSCRGPAGSSRGSRSGPVPAGEGSGPDMSA